MVSYYQLRHSSEPKVIGVRNGVQQVEIQDEGVLSSPSFDQVVKFFCKDVMASDKFVEPSFVPKFQYVKPLDKAILTDFLSYGPFFPSCPFMSSETATNVLTSFNVQEHRFYDARVVRNDVAVNYKIFYCPALGYDVIDFQASKFYLGNFVVGKEYLNFNSVEEYKEFLASNRALLVRAEKLSLSSAFDDSLDLMVLKFGGVYVSSRLRDEILRLGLTGVNCVSCFDESDEGKVICVPS